MNGAPNAKLQLRVLWREFLFRIADLEVLSAHALGDANKLLGQFAALLVLISAVLSLGALGGDSDMAPSIRLAVTLYMEHFLIATTMLVVGIFAVLTWDSTFPDRRDVLVLAPLPVRVQTLFLAKVAATGTALGLVVLVLHCATGLTWPFAFAARSAGLTGIARAFVAYWITMAGAAALVYCGVLGIQGFAAQILPRTLFLRVSGFLQMAAFCVFVCAYFLEPAVDNLQMLAAPENRNLLLWLPSYWFLGLFHQLNGTTYASLVPLARRAWMGLAVSGLATFVAYALSYMRTMRQIAEEPDLTSSAHGFRWLPPFGNQLQTAIGQFSVRTMARSRQHRLIWAFYLGIGLAFTVLLLQSGTAINGWHEANTPLLAASIMMMALAVAGLRIAFAFPLEPPANWIFRVAGVRRGPEVLTATGRVLLLLAASPVWLVSAVICLRLWPRGQAEAHLTVLGLLAAILVDFALWGFRKIPFTCSYLPGKSQVHMVFLAAVGLMWVVGESVVFEQQALQERGVMVGVLALLGVMAIAVRLHVRAPAISDESDLQFEEAPNPAVLELGLFRDGAVIGTRPRDPLTETKGARPEKKGYKDEAR
jgi:hypothetical protein